MTGVFNNYKDFKLYTVYMNQTTTHWKDRSKAKTKTRYNFGNYIYY